MDETSTNQTLSMQYEIRVKGTLSDQWIDWFDGMTIDQDTDGNTIMRGSVDDQSALHGLLDKIQDMGLNLLSVRQILE